MVTFVCVLKPCIVRNVKWILLLGIRRIGRGGPDVKPRFFDWHRAQWR
jgi:hypothetical protein